MGKVHIHTKRILIPLMGITSFFILYVLVFYNAKEDIHSRVVLQRLVQWNAKNADRFYNYFYLNGSSHLACVQPNLKVNNSVLQRFIVQQDPLLCEEEAEWVTVDGDLATISHQAKMIHGIIKCTFSELLFKNDDETKVGQAKTTMDSFLFTGSDFYDVTCVAKDGKSWQNTLAGIHKNRPREMDFKWENVPKDAVHLNVIMIGFDSLSHSNFIRNLPKTYKYLNREMQSHILESYNIVGDGTPQALIPILTGKTELELPDTRKRIKGANFVDVYPFVWKNFKKNGYVTLFAEDQPAVNTFNYRLKGFSSPPTDHYMRIFYNHIHPFYNQHHKYCLRGTPRHQIFLNYLKNFFEVYKDVPKFAFAFHSELSHNDYNLISVADDDIVDFIKSLNVKGHLEDSIIFMFSDHGNRFAAIRATQEGKQEERLPFFSIYLPKKFKELYPSAADNIRVNTGRLTTPFDIYSTILDLTKFSGAKLGKISERSISLFSEIPPSRTCSDAFIEPHWCACLAWEPIPITDDKVVEAANALVHYINSFTSPFRAYCHEIILDSIVSAALLLPNQGVIKFKQTKDYDGFLPDLSSNTAITEEVYQISITTTPNKNFFRTSSNFPTYEASLTYNIKQDSFSVKISDVSRINAYGDQPHCIINTQPQLRKFCYCLEPPNYLNGFR